MLENEFKDKLIDALQLYFDKDTISADVVNHLARLCEKVAKEKCEIYKQNIIDYLFKEWEIDKDNLEENITHGIKSAPLPDFKWL